MPDALSKTVPIWACVWNRLLFPDVDEAQRLSTPQDVVGESEHAQIASRLDDLVADLGALDLDLDRIRKTLRKPLTPVWVTQASDVPMIDDQLAYYPIVLCTASGRDAGNAISGFDYVQGAADDAEAWALGLTATSFWHHRSELLQLSEDELVERIPLITSNGNDEISAVLPTLIKPTTQLYIGTNPCSTDALPTPHAHIACEQPVDNNDTSPKEQGHTFRVPCQPGKLGSRTLRHHLPSLVPFVTKHLASHPTSPILIICPTGKDHSIGVALALLCLFSSPDGTLTSTNDSTRTMNKDFIKKRLSWIMASIPDANPSRATLQSVNAFLLG
ncbi:Diadenosine 5',5'''-P1,P4-tetraphosphate phosphorylase 2 [Sphaceloma murrayae]|uniref:Diadenosine 5',5'''-P1,P4-tetraphosphate phosphorylase 2 n=1 Tax=Sphaceloma murrayae TaxID=2082308 RepID=A0A2K1QJY2_9PEZI|nr:Diadenosine 5',5'''-P1,P4-tetraphosphate phosphorylase 2 [Sphaceloma murrayae]